MEKKGTDIEKTDDRLMPSLHEQIECRRVFNRQHVPVPAVESEWERFRARMGEQDAARRRRSSRLYVVGGLMASVAAAVLWFFVIPAFRSVEEPSLTTKIPVPRVEFPVNGADAGSAQSPATVPSALRQGNLTVQSDMVSMRVVTAPHGKDMQLTLSDGTKVWLYADSRIEYPEFFYGLQRQVRLHGEAFFEVTRDIRRPFVVSSDFFSTTVHGTAFSVEACSKDKAEVVLVSGSVSVRKNGDREEYEIRPGEKAEIGQDGNFEIHETDIWPYIQRRNGYFYFNHEPLGEIMRELGRWYNVNVVFEDPKLMNIRFHFVAERNQNLQTVIRSLNEIGSVEVIFDDGALTVR